MEGGDEEETATSDAKGLSLEGFLGAGVQMPALGCGAGCLCPWRDVVVYEVGRTRVVCFPWTPGPQLSFDSGVSSSTKSPGCLLVCETRANFAGVLGGACWSALRWVGGGESVGETKQGLVLGSDSVGEKR